MIYVFVLFSRKVVHVESKANKAFNYSLVIVIHTDKPFHMSACP